MPQKEANFNGVKWIHLAQPTAEELSALDNLFPYHPLIKESITAPTLHPLIEGYNDHLFLILHFPLISPTYEANAVAEVDFLITQKVLVTIAYRPFFNLEEIFKKFQEGQGLLPEHPQDTGLLLYHVIDRLLQKLIRDLDFLEEQITKIEDKIFEKKDRLVEEISHTRRDILDLRRPLKPQAEVLKTLVDVGGKFYGPPIVPYFLDLTSSEERIRTFIENQKETIEALHQTHESLMSSYISNIIAVLTIFSAVILPLNFIASIWGMNHRFLPLRDGPTDFWLILGLMLTIAVGLLLFFRKKRWL